MYDFWPKSFQPCLWHRISPQSSHVLAAQRVQFTRHKRSHSSCHFAGLIITMPSLGVLLVRDLTSPDLDEMTNTQENHPFGQGHLHSFPHWMKQKQIQSKHEQGDGVVFPFRAQNASLVVFADLSHSFQVPPVLGPRSCFGVH